MPYIEAAVDHRCAVLADSSGRFLVDELPGGSVKGSVIWEEVGWFQHMWIIPLPKFDIAPEKRWWEDYFPIGKANLQGYVCFREGIGIKINCMILTLNTLPGDVLV